MHKVLLSIGTNTNACFNLRQAIKSLLIYFPTIQFTKIIKSKPHGASYKSSFLNTLGYFETNMSKDEIILRFKSIEKNMGRQPSHKAEGKVIIDIDLIKIDEEVLKPDDFERSYMSELLSEIMEITNN